MAEILTALPQLPRRPLEAPSIEPPPLLEEPAAALAEPESLQPAGLDVLAVEDNPVNRMVLEQILGSISVSFRIAGSAADGLADYAASMARVVLSDTTLPDMSATDFVLGVRKIDPSAVLVALVPADTEENHRKARAAGFDYSLSKPLSAEALDALVPDLIAARRSASPIPNGSTG